MTSTEKQYLAGEFTDAELDAAADAGDRYLVHAPIENERAASDFVCEFRNKNRDRGPEQSFNLAFEMCCAT
jgi:hypothetical protein